jgi:nucleotide-binding universal stress UspA family protein
MLPRQPHRQNWEIRMNKIKCVLHPTDFSQSAAGAFAVARSFAHDHGARIILLHVTEAPVVGPAGVVPFPPPAPPIDRDALKAQLRAIATADPDVHFEARLAEGQAASAILDVAKESACDVIVMGTHGRTGLSRLLMGSTAEQVVRHATCPVLTVKTPPPSTP